MIIVEFSANGQCVPDLTVEDWARELVAMSESLDEDIIINVGNELMVDAIRVMVKEDVISHTEVMLRFDGEDISLDKNARPRYWPKGMCDTHCGILARLCKRKV